MPSCSSLIVHVTGCKLRSRNINTNLDIEDGQYYNVAINIKYLKQLTVFPDGQLPWSSFQPEPSSRG